jgi:hypothetical protein
MYRESDLQNCLWGLVGFRQNANPNYPTLPASLLQSDTGLYFQQAHPLLSIENIHQALTNYDAYAYPAYNNATEYAEMEKVRAADNKVYESLEDGNVGNEPSASPEQWVEVPLFAQRLESIVRGSLNKIMAAIATHKKIVESTKTLLENTTLFDGSGSLQDKEVKLGRFVGFKLMLDDHRSILAIIRRIGTQFTAANPDFKLFIFHTSQVEPIQVIDLALTKVNSFEWKKIEAELRYNSETYGPGGSFRIGYYEDLLEGQAINRGYNFGVSPKPCNCNNWYPLWARWSRFFIVEPFAVIPDVVPEADGSGAELWNLESEISYHEKSFGLNLDLSVLCDVTDFVCRERRVFTEAVNRQVTVDLLNEMSNSVRNNPLAKEVRDLAKFELLNKPDGNLGEIAKLEKAIQALNFDFSDMNEACLPCNNSNGPTYTTF